MSDYVWRERQDYLEAEIARLRERIEKLEKDVLLLDLIDMGEHYELPREDGERLEALQNRIARAALDLIRRGQRSDNEAAKENHAVRAAQENK